LKSKSPIPLVPSSLAATNVYGELVGQGGDRPLLGVAETPTETLHTTAAKDVLKNTLLLVERLLDDEGAHLKFFMVYP
jgi:hypothetical protein